MCRKYYIEFWTPSNYKSGLLERLAIAGQLSEPDNPFASLRRVTFYECRSTGDITYHRVPQCTHVTDCGRQGAIRAYCPGDDCCQVRIVWFGQVYDMAVERLQGARREAVAAARSDPAAQRERARRVVDLRRLAELALGEWRFVYEEHLFCPQHKMADWMICTLVNAGAMDRPQEMWPDRRLGQDPRGLRVP